MRLLPLLILVTFLSACSKGSDLEQRRLHTIERMQWGGGTDEDKRVQQLIVNALQQADTQSLQTPQLINVTMRIIQDDSKRGSLSADWISSQPFATGIRVQFSDGTESDINIDPIELDYNRELATELVLFAGNPFLEREYPETWERLLADQDAKVVLIADNASVSNSVQIYKFVISVE